MYKVVVLLSSYNGAKYIEEQINSLLSQEGVSLMIIVRDDGSSDGTQNILDAYQEQGLLKWYQGNNIGWARSFMHLLQNAPSADYYAFCDQDDIWLPNKLKVAISKLKGIDNSIKMYCSNLTNYRSGVECGLVRKEILLFSKYNSLIYNISNGCTSVFSKGLVDIIKQNPPKVLYAHDYWIYQSAIFLGEVYYDNDSYILYRQHEANEVGGTKSFWQNCKIRWNRLKSIKEQHEREMMAKELINCYSNYLRKDDVTIIKKVADYRQSFFKRISLLLDNKYSFSNRVSNFFLKIRIIISHL